MKCGQPVHRWQLCRAFRPGRPLLSAGFFRRYDLMASMGLRENCHADEVTEEFF
jgi:hypothetical protein